MKVQELRRATTAVAAQLKKDWEVEHAKLLGMLQTHESMPNNYWVNEHRARALYHSALALEELLCSEDLVESTSPS